MRRRRYTGLIYIMPWMIGLLVFQLYPFLYSLILSFTNKTLSNNTSFIGLDNYVRLFTRDRDFQKVVQVTLKYVVFAVPGRVLFALLVALLMNVNRRGVNLLRTIYYLPSIFGGSVAVAVIWKLMFQNSGVINAFLNTLGIASVKWLGHPKVALTTIILIPIGSVPGRPEKCAARSVRGCPDRRERQHPDVFPDHAAHDFSDPALQSYDADDILFPGLQRGVCHDRRGTEPGNLSVRHQAVQ